MDFQTDIRALAPVRRHSDLKVPGGGPVRLGDLRMNYASWRAHAAAELKLLHGIDADRIPERVWKQFYVQNSSSREAADRAERHYANSKPVLERAQHWLKVVRGG